jgi:thioredoxin 1
MQTSSGGKGPILAAAGLLVAAGTLAFCKASSNCYVGAWSRQEVPTSTPTLGEKNMSIVNAQSQIHHADDASFRDLVLTSDVPVLVDFYADWCQPCQRIAPLLEEVAVEIPGARIVKVNVDHSPGLASEYGVTSIPNLMIFKNGTVSDQLVGLASKSQLRAMLAP